MHRLIQSRGRSIGRISSCQGRGQRQQHIQIGGYQLNGWGRSLHRSFNTLSHRLYDVLNTFELCLGKAIINAFDDGGRAAHNGGGKISPGCLDACTGGFCHVGKSAYSVIQFKQFRIELAESYLARLQRGIQITLRAFSCKAKGFCRAVQRKPHGFL